MMWSVTGEDIELVAKTSGEVVAALADTSGALALPREYATYVASLVHLRHYPRLVERAMSTAEKIRTSGLPAAAYDALDEPLLTAILKATAEERDPAMQTLWENLLANALTEESTQVRRAFPGILGELDPTDARLLDDLARQTADATYRVDQLTQFVGVRDGVPLDNLTRLELLRPVRKIPTTVGSIAVDDTTITGYVFTELGWAFVSACQPPQSEDA
jgi:hypothetical protein